MSRSKSYALCTLLVGLCASASPITAHASASDAPDTLVNTLLELQQQAHIPALGLILMRDGEPQLIGTWGTIDEHTPMRWGSITKSFTALGALKLAQEQNLDLHTPVDQLLSATYYHNPWAGSSPVRLIDLLELTAGFPDLSRSEFADNTPRTLIEALNRHAVERRLRWPPGWQHSYSNVPPGITAAVIEAQTGKSFEQYMKDAVLDPLSMPKAGFLPLKELPGGYQADGTTPIPYWHMTFRAFGALNASLSEMTGFLRALLNDGRLGSRQALPPGLVARMRKAAGSLGARAGLALTYAAGIYPWITDGQVFWGHGGDADGYRSRYGLLPEAGRGYLLVINTDNPAVLRRMQRLIEQWLTQDLSAPGVPPLFEDLDAQRHAGDYYPASARFGLARWQAGEAARARIVLSTNGLEFHREGRITRLYPIAAGQYRRLTDPATTVVFTETDTGERLMQGELGNYVNLSHGHCPAFLAWCARE